MEKVESHKTVDDQGKERHLFELSDELLMTLKAVSIVYGLPEEEFIAKSLKVTLSSIVLQRTFAGEFADACRDYDQQHPNEDGTSTHASLAPYVMNLRAEARNP